MARPDFLIVGAMKCGTSTLHSQLSAQPGVFMTTPKEPNFFSDDDIYSRGLDWYESLFEDAEQSDLKGEASTHYTKLPDYPKTVERIARSLFPIRIVYVIRDPLERAISHYLHEWSRGVVGNDVEAAFRDHPEFLSYSCYARQIAPYVEQFGLNSILVLTLEDMKSNPTEFMARLGDFLGRPDLAWNHGLEPVNESAERSRPLPFHSLLVDHPVARHVRRKIVPKGVRTWIRRQRMPKERPELPDHLRTRLLARFQEDAEELAVLLSGSKEDA